MAVAMVLETCRDGASVADNARRHDFSPPQLHAWRRAARDGLLPMPDAEAPVFLPVSIPGTARDPPDDRSGPLTPEIGNGRILVPATLSVGRAIAAVRGAS